jgi:hypothetical protein
METSVAFFQLVRLLYPHADGTGLNPFRTTFALEQQALLTVE